MNTDAPAPWVFIIDTEQYSGNFERPLTAWITGQVGECGVGDTEAKVANRVLPKAAKTWFEEHVLSLPDEHGCCRPTSIWETPGWFNDGHGNEWREGSDPEAVRAKYLASVHAYYDPLVIFAEEKMEIDPIWGSEAAIYRQNGIAAEARGPGHYPSYQSVAIFLDAEPPPDILALMKERADCYNLRKGREKWDTIITVIGFRLIQQEIKRRQVERSV